MRKDNQDTGAVESLTRWAMALHSRRGFLNGLGKFGLSTVAAIVGVSLAPQMVSATAPACPEPCEGPCSSGLTPSCCITGGKRCCWQCPCDFADVCGSYGYFTQSGSNCVFSCACYGCP